LKNEAEAPAANVGAIVGAEVRNVVSFEKIRPAARPVEQPTMASNGSIDTGAAGKLPAVSGTPVFLNASQAAAAATYLATNWAQAVK